MGTDDPTDVLAHEQFEAEQEETRKERSRQSAEDLKWLMADKRGRRVIWRLLSLTGLFHNPMTGNSTTFFNCGKMLIGQTIFADINIHCPEKYETMVRENTAK